MLSRLDAVALALLWTEQAGARPSRPVESSRRPGILPRGLRLRDAATLEEAIEEAGEVATRLRSHAADALAESARAGIGIVVFGEPAYPALLAEIPDPPPAFWIDGALPPVDARVAIVGSRNATPHGLQVAARLGEDLARAGSCVVSGLARGVDGAAHRGALRAGGPTIAVLGSGVDVAYPPEHAALARDVAEHGALVSEFPPGTPPRGWHFPRRNRVISGLCHAVVVVEASDHSGSLITARCALAQGREVMAVPGGVLSGRNRGAHGLLRDGAGVVEGASDVLEQLNWSIDWLPRGEASTKIAPREAWLRAMVAGEAYDVEGLCALSGLDPVPMLARLSQLELAGWIVRDGGGRFVKADGNVLR
jgi:DNA processing protein